MFVTCDILVSFHNCALWHILAAVIFGIILRRLRRMEVLACDEAVEQRTLRSLRRARAAFAVDRHHMWHYHLNILCMRCVVSVWLVPHDRRSCSQQLVESCICHSVIGSFALWVASPSDLLRNGVGYSHIVVYCGIFTWLLHLWVICLAGSISVALPILMLVTFCVRCTQ